MIDFQPMPKRFMVWDKVDKKFLDDPSKACAITPLGALITRPDMVICQSTNLFDKDGKEIFEGSIIKVPDDYEEYGMAAGGVYEIYFNAGGFRLKPYASYAVERRLLEPAIPSFTSRLEIPLSLVFWKPS